MRWDDYEAHLQRFRIIGNLGTNFLTCPGSQVPDEVLCNCVRGTPCCSVPGSRVFQGSFQSFHHVRLCLHITEEKKKVEWSTREIASRKIDRQDPLDHVPRNQSGKLYCSTCPIIRSITEDLPGMVTTSLSKWELAWSNHLM